MRAGVQAQSASCFNIPMKLTPEKNLVLLLSQPFPSEKALHAVADLYTKTGGKIDLAEIDSLLSLFQTAPLFYRNIRETAWSCSEMLERYKRAYFAGLSIAEAQIRETLSVVAVLGNEQIKAIPLKGPIGAELLFGDPALYRSSDIDLLVRPKDIEKALVVLAALGYQRTTSIDLRDEMTGSYHITVSKDAFHIELHWNLVMRYFSADPGFWWGDMKEIEYRGQRILQLSYEKLLLYLAFRLFSKGFVPLRYFMLPLGLISGQDAAFDWDKFMIYARELKMQRLANFTANLLHDIFCTEIPEAARRSRSIGYGILKNKVMEGLSAPRINTHLRMVMFLILLDTPADIFSVLLRRIFPTSAEIRLRYTIPRSSLMLLPYYLLNPFLMLLKKIKR